MSVCIIFPSMLEISSVIPTFKTRDKSYVKHYRPISILNHIAKLFELLVLKKMQYDFRLGRSAILNLIVLNNFLLEAIENHFQVNVISTDFVVAFDRIDYAIFIDVLYKTGFGEPIFNWLKSYLSVEYNE